MDAVDVAAAAAAALDGAVLNGMPPSPLVADLTQGVSVERDRDAGSTPGARRPRSAGQHGAGRPGQARARPGSQHATSAGGPATWRCPT